MIKKWVVTNLISELEIKTSQMKGNLKFSFLGMFGVLPVFNTEQGAKDYIKTLNNPENYNYFPITMNLKDVEKLSN